MNIIRIDNEIISLENVLKVDLSRLSTDSWKIYFYYNNNSVIKTAVLTEDLAKESFNKIEKILKTP